MNNTIQNEVQGLVCVLNIFYESPLAYKGNIQEGNSGSFSIFSAKKNNLIFKLLFSTYYLVIFNKKASKNLGTCTFS